MSGTDWKDLEALWRDLPERAAPAVAELERMKRWRWLSRAFVVSDVVMTLFGIAAGVWLIGRGDWFSVVMGVASLVFVPIAAVLSFWARSIRAGAAEAPVQAALDLAINNARIGVRLSMASFWTVFAALLFLAVLVFASVWLGEVDTVKLHGLLTAIGASLVWLAIVLAVTIVYYGQRRETLTKLERLRDAFGQEV